MNGINTRIDFTSIRTAAARRLHRPDLPDKLVLLRRLARRYAEGSMQRRTETQVEQSFNAQLFARVFDYRTLLSHDAGTFDLLPKSRSHTGTDDFSLGIFGGDGERVIASAELKSPGASLIKAQRGDAYHGESAIEQAFRTARGHEGCRWVVASNTRELWLFDAQAAEIPIVRADLLSVATLEDLAFLCSHVDRRALLGDSRCEAEMNTLVVTPDPNGCFPHVEGSSELVARFTPSADMSLSLFALDQGFRKAIPRLSLQCPDIHNMDPSPGEAAIVAANGWVRYDSPESVGRRIRLAASRHGQLLMCATIRQGSSAFGGETIRSVALQDLFECFRLFNGLLCHFTVGRGSFRLSGTVSADLRSVRGVGLGIGTGFESLRAEGSPAFGKCSENDVFTGEFDLPDNFTVGVLHHTIAQLVCELVANFRCAAGGIGIRSDDLPPFLQLLNAPEDVPNRA